MTYRIVINGINTGATKQEVVNRLASLFKTSENKVVAILDRPGFVVKEGVDRQTAAQYEAALQDRGCVCTVEPDAVIENLSFDLPPSSTQLPSLTSMTETAEALESPSTPVWHRVAVGLPSLVGLVISLALFGYFVNQTLGDPFFFIHSVTAGR